MKSINIISILGLTALVGGVLLSYQGVSKVAASSSSRISERQSEQQQLLMHARSTLEAGDWQQAKRIYQSVVERHPSDSFARMIYARELDQHGEKDAFYKESVTLFNKTHHSNWTWSLYHLARLASLAEKKGDEAFARLVWQKAEQQVHNDSRILSAPFEMRKGEDLLDYRYVQGDPESLRTFIWVLAMDQASGGGHDGNALRCLEVVRRRLPDRQYEWDLLEARFLNALGRIEEAEAIYRRLIREAPTEWKLATRKEAWLGPYDLKTGLDNGPQARLPKENKPWLDRTSPDTRPKPVPTRS